QAGLSDTAPPFDDRDLRARTDESLELLELMASADESPAVVEKPVLPQKRLEEFPRELIEPRPGWSEEGLAYGLSEGVLDELARRFAGEPPHESGDVVAVPQFPLCAVVDRLTHARTGAAREHDQ